MRYRMQHGYPDTQEGYQAIANDVLAMAGQVAQFCDDLDKKGIAYPDIKAENFLLRDDGTVVTADLKSVIRTQNGQLAKGEISTTFSPPEMRGSDAMSSNAWMSFQIGLMTYDLMVGGGTGEAKPWLDDFFDGNDLDFSAPVFQSQQGQQVKSLIERAMDRDPSQRPTLAEFSQQTAQLKIMPEQQANAQVANLQ